MLKLHLGCGPHIKQGWLNYDIEPGKGGLRHDLRRGIPQPDKSADFVYHEHFLEHLTQAEGLAFLKECHRVLKPGGVMRIVMPDLRALAFAYVGQEQIFLPGVWEPKTPAQMLNEGMREWGHKFLYDFDELELALIEAGFDAHGVLPVAHGASLHPELNRIEVRPDLKDLVVEATKRGTE